MEILEAEEFQKGPDASVFFFTLLLRECRLMAGHMYFSTVKKAGQA